VPLPPLPETADELRAIAKTLGASEADLLLGERASRCCVGCRLTNRRSSSSATHGLMAPFVLIGEGGAGR
jgi:hypothetical protein